VCQGSPDGEDEYPTSREGGPKKLGEKNGKEPISSPLAIKKPNYDTFEKEPVFACGLE